MQDINKDIENIEANDGVEPSPRRSTVNIVRSKIKLVNKEKDPLQIK